MASDGVATCEDMERWLEQAHADLDAARAEVSALRAALERYGRHRQNPSFCPATFLDGVCDCGLADALGRYPADPQEEQGG